MVQVHKTLATALSMEGIILSTVSVVSVGKLRHGPLKAPVEDVRKSRSLRGASALTSTTSIPTSTSNPGARKHKK